jgi:hypothetical protein
MHIFRPVATQHNAAHGQYIARPALASYRAPEIPRQRFLQQKLAPNPIAGEYGLARCDLRGNPSRLQRLTVARDVVQAL